jgi:septal ring factor EnvC (AmiA/AmiB activator)
VSIQLTDNDGRTLDPNGGRFTSTLEIAFLNNNSHELVINAAAAQRQLEVNLTQIKSMYQDLAGRVTVEETKNDRQDTDIDGLKTDLVALTNMVSAFADDLSAANIRTDNVTAAGFDTDI